MKKLWILAIPMIALAIAWFLEDNESVDFEEEEWVADMTGS